ncbi:MAG: hypothetical protein N2515_08910 [Deltaproteobacteria bacterium]|nr:hypothetical protein [Deltaproteobacteria bacterium]
MQGSPSSHRLIYRWDLDKTYLHTNFDRFRDLLRTAFESAQDKKTIPGAATLLQEIKKTNPFGIFIVSGSPTQLRKVLESKLRLDGIEWDDLVLKPQLENLLKVRIRFLRDQIAYKLSALIESRLRTPPEIREYMFGDDAEADAFIYSLFSDLCTRRIGIEVLEAVLEQARVYEEFKRKIIAIAKDLPQGGGAERIFIHLDRVSLPQSFDAFGKRVVPFFNYFQPAFLLFADGVLGAEAVLRVAEELHLEHGFGIDALAASVRDLVERGHVGGSAIRRLASELEGA